MFYYIKHVTRGIIKIPQITCIFDINYKTIMCNMNKGI